MMPKEDPFFKKSLKTPEEKVEEALRKALDNTTIERPGTPWDGEDEDDGDEGEWI
jgi:hypothetical protein